MGNGTGYNGYRSKKVKVKRQTSDEGARKMASGVSDAIENFIKALLEGEDARADLQRNELAARFGCAPSQINYVLSTRFTSEHGYRIESRRGGGGYVRIYRIQPSKAAAVQALCEALPPSLSEDEARAALLSLLKQGLLSRREASLLFSAVREELLPGPAGAKLRAAQLKNALLFLKNEQ